MQIKSTVTGSPEVNIGAGALELKYGGNTVALTADVDSLQQGTNTVTLNATAGVTVTGTGAVTINGPGGKVSLAAAKSTFEFGSGIVEINSVGVYVNTTFNVQDKFLVTGTKVEANQPFYATAGWGNAARERVSLLPSPTANASKFLRVKAYESDVEWGTSGSAVAWADVSGKPTTFPPIIGPATTDAAAGDHGHAYSSLTGLPTLGTAAAADIGTGSGNVAAGNHNHSSTYSALGHTHTSASITDGITGAFTAATLGTATFTNGILTFLTEAM